MPAKLPSGLPPMPSDWRKMLWHPAFLAVCAAAAAALLMPRQMGFPFTFAEGQVWSHKSLTAPFDFEVLRPENEVRDALARTEREHGRYYLASAEVARAQKRALTQLIDNQVKISRHDEQYADLVANVGAYATYGQKLLDKVYERGVLAEADDFLKEDPAAQVWLAGIGSERRVALSSLLTLKSAREFLTDSLPFSPLRQPEILLPMLEKSLAPNVRYSDSLTLVSKRRKIAAIVSTGITVRRGEKIVERDQLVSAEIAQKLRSLASRYDAPKGMEVVFGYFLAALLAFGGYFFWLKNARPCLWENPPKLLFLLGSILFSLFLVSLAGRATPAAPLVLPFCAMPILLARLFDRDTGQATWGLAISLAAFALDWGMGWLSIQIAGGTSAMWLLARAKTWQGRIVATAIVAFAMLTAWLACWFAERLPDGGHLAEVPFFLLVAAFLALMAFPLSSFLSQKFSPETPSNLPQPIDNQ